MTAEQSRRWGIIIKVILFAALIYFPLFLHLTGLPIRLWDEARLANNAVEMYQNGNYLVPHYRGGPDMWNTKPPLMIWIQTLLFHLIGPGELAVRLPSALAAVGVAVLMMLVSIKYLHSYWYGLIAVAVLVTSQGFVELHATRTGDYDSLLTFFTTGYCLAIFLYLKTRSIKFFHLFFMGLGLALLTKGIQGVLFLPAIGILFFIRREHLSVFRNKWLYIDTALVLLVIVGYYLLRERYNPGYLQAVWQNELGGRYGSPLEGHGHGFWYYLNLMTYRHFTFWIWALPVGIVATFMTKDQRIKQFLLFCLWVSVTYWLIISFSATKLEWYDLPIIPFLALLVAAPLYFVLPKEELLSIGESKFGKGVISALVLVFIFVYPYSSVINRIYDPSPVDRDEPMYQICYYLRMNQDKPDILKGLNIGYYRRYEAHSAHILFYTKILNARGYDIDFIGWTELQPGEKIIANQDDVKDYIEQHYRFTVLANYYTVKVYQIDEIRPPTS